MIFHYTHAVYFGMNFHIDIRYCNTHSTLRVRSANSSLFFFLPCLFSVLFFWFIVLTGGILLATYDYWPRLAGLSTNSDSAGAFDVDGHGFVVPFVFAALPSPRASTDNDGLDDDCMDDVDGIGCGCSLDNCMNGDGSSTMLAGGCVFEGGCG